MNRDARYVTYVGPNGRWRYTKQMSKATQRKMETVRIILFAVVFVPIMISFAMGIHGHLGN